MVVDGRPKATTFAQRSAGCCVDGIGVADPMISTMWQMELVKELCDALRKTGVHATFCRGRP